MMNNIRHTITIELDPYQNDFISQQIEKSGLSFSKFIKRTLLLRYRTPEIKKLLEKIQKLLSKSSLTKKDEIKLFELKEQIGWLPTTYSLEDDEAMEIVHKAADIYKSKSIGLRDC